jgi:hypothetical protein
MELTLSVLSTTNSLYWCTIICRPKWSGSLNVYRSTSCLHGWFFMTWLTLRIWLSGGSGRSHIIMIVCYVIIMFLRIGSICSSPAN